MEIAAFEKLLASKERKFRITAHALIRITERAFNKDIIENEIQTGTPVLVVEEPCDVAGEQKLRIYYKQSGPHYHAYIIALNAGITVITVWRENKEIQKRIRK